MAVRLYADDHGDVLPAAANLTFGTLATNHFAVFYKGMVKSYVGLSGASSVADRVFVSSGGYIFHC